jgi:hypothetical protein
VFSSVGVGIVGHLAASRASPFVSRGVCKLEPDPTDRPHSKSLGEPHHTSHVHRHARQGRLRRPLRGVNPLTRAPDVRVGSYEGASSL